MPAHPARFRPRRAAALPGQPVPCLQLSLLRPALGTLWQITACASWNTSIGRLSVMRLPEVDALPPVLRRLRRAVNTVWGGLTTGSAIGRPPLVVVVMLCSGQLISGLPTGAVQ